MSKNAWKKKLGKNIKSFRLKKGLTQEEAAELYDCSLRGWQRFERGVNTEVASLVRIAKVLRVKVSKLVKW